MKKLKYVFFCLCMIFILSACGKKVETIEVQEPDIKKIRAICNLATIEAYYHNVATDDIPAGSGFTSIFKKDRKVWIEYTGKVRIGIDMSKVNMTIDGDNIKITMPKAKILSLNVDKIDKDSYYYSEDNKIFFKNKITPEKQTEVINKAQNRMKKAAEEDEHLLLRARERAQSLIEKYIKVMGEISKKEYKIEWQYEEDIEK